MKVRYNLNWVLSLCAVLFAGSAFAQTVVTMPYNTGVNTVNTIACNATNSYFQFVDNGGVAGVYSNSSNPATSMTTFAPSDNNHLIRTSFAAFSTEATWDALYPRNGADAAAPQMSSGSPIGFTFLAGGWYGGTNPVTNTITPQANAGVTGCPAPFSFVQAAPNGGTVPANALGAGGAFGANTSATGGALFFQFDSDASVNCAGWNAFVIQIPKNIAASTMTAPANQSITISTATNCVGQVTTPAPSVSWATLGTTTAGFTSVAALSYSLNGGAEVAVGTYTVNNTPALTASTVPASVTITGIPAGANTITWYLKATCNGTAFPAAVGITPTIAIACQAVQATQSGGVDMFCPSNTIISLDEGQCEKSYCYDVTAKSCNGFAGPISTLSSPNPGWTQTGQNTYYFNFKNNSAFPISLKSVDPRLWGFGAATTMRVYVTAAGGTYVGNQANLGVWTQVHTSNITIPNTGITAVGFANPLVPCAIQSAVTMGPGETRGIAIFSTTFYGGGPIAANNAGATTWSDANTTLTCGPGSLCNSNPFATLGPGSPFAGNWSYCGNVQYQIFTQSTTYTTGNPFFMKVPPTTPEPCANLNYKNSPFTFGFKATDAAGNTGTCSWTVVVKEFPNPITGLVCNNNVQLSLDEDCSVCMGADQVLEGGPYHCYDDYAVEVSKNNQMAGPWTTACLGNADINKTYLVRVRDLKTPFNTCWGNVHVEDKLPPKLACANVTVACNANTAPQYVAVPGTAVLEMGPAPINDNQTSTTTRSYATGGFPAIISDVNIAIDITHTWIGDVALSVKSPAGTTINLWNNNCGTNDNLFYVADDEGITSNLCVDYVSGQNINLTILSPASPLSLLDGQDAQGTWTMNVSDNVAGDNGTLNHCTLFIQASAIPATYAPMITDNCKTFPVPYMAPMVTYNDNIVDNGCNGAVISRTWVAKDQSNNSASCTQTITLTPAVLGDVTLPDDYDNIDLPALDCSDLAGNYPYPDVIDAVTGTVSSPNINGAGAGDYCHIAWNYVDLVIDVCDGTYKIKRTWTIIDWCTGTGFDYVQLIKVLDSTGPQIDVDADVNTPGLQVPNVLQNVPTVILTTDYYQCCSKNDAPALIVSDDCSSVISAKVSTPIGNLNGVITNLGTWPVTYQVTFPNNGALCFPLGTHVFTYTVKDDCGNTSTKTQRVIVRDWTPPVALCQEFTTVAVGTDDPYDCYPADGKLTADNQGGIVWVPATAFNDGSYDNCGNIALTVRRMSPYSDCINTLNPQDGDPYCDPNDIIFDLVSEYALAISENDSIKFYCCEVGTDQTVILRVYEVDENGNFVFGPDNQPIYNECMINVEVQDKIKPFCQAPANKTVNCDEYDPLNWYGNLTYGDNCCVSKIDTAITYVPNQITFEQCNYGQVRRSFTVRDCNNNSSRCTQTITVNYKELYRVYFPDDKNFTVCNTPGATDVPQIYGENCELIGVTHEDQLFTVVPDACYKILRTWKVINWCTYNPNLGEVIIPNSNTSTQGARVWIGEGGTKDYNDYNPNSPDVPTINSKNWTYPAPLTGNATNPEGTPAYVYTQVIKVQDATPPQANIDPQLGTANYTFCDYSTNDPNQWNQDASYNPWGITGTWSPTCQSHDLCEGNVDLSIWATDACSEDDLNFRYLLFLDLDGNGTMETTINSENPTWGFGIREDEKTTINGVKYLKGQVTRDFETDDPDHTKYGQFALPYGTHKIKWTVEDRCGNDFTKEWTIIVKDCKNPTVVCINGLAVNQMNTPVGVMAPAVTLWATDFLQYAEDNCTDASQIVFALRDADINPGSGFPLDANGQPQSSLTWDCSQIGTNIVELWAKDKWGNADFCLTYLILSDNTGACVTPGAGSVAGEIKNATNVGVADTKVTVSGSNAALPNPKVFNTVDDGIYNLNGLPIANDYTIAPTKDVNPLNGVSTFDLVRMSKHILNVQPFTTGYEYLAADINNNKQVTTFDIVELRKLILGIYTDFPQNDSWRFVDKTFNFNMNSATPPLQQAFPEIIQVGNLSGANGGKNFTAVKIGDLTGDAIANNAQQVSDRNPVATTLVDINDRDVKAGEEFSVEFNSADLSKVSGYQFTMNFPNLEFVELTPGANLTADNFAVFAADKAITTSWNGDAANATFSVKFRATADGKLSNMLGVSGRITAAEAYTKNNEQMDVAFRFNGANGSTIAGVGFELYQNQPNPFVESTNIGFNLPEAAKATLTVFNAEGKALYSTTQQFSKGINTVKVDRAALKGAGLTYYTLETNTDSATRKMIMMD